MDFLNHREGGMFFYQVFLLFPLQCRVTFLYEYVRGFVSLKKYVRCCMSFKKYKSQGKAVNSKKENSEDFCLDLIQEFGLWQSS
jgi:hypothetical protein